MAKLSSEETYMIYFILCNRKIKLNKYSMEFEQPMNIFFISLEGIFSRFEYHICCKYCNWFCFRRIICKNSKEFEQNSFENQGVIQKCLFFHKK